jgi:hypothetical protein
MNSIPRVTFGMIVLNGEPFIKYNLRALYPFAHQIIVVEGASPHAHSIATQNGHSTDDTLDVLRNFKRHEDPNNKIQIVTAEQEGYPNGFWPGEKNEQSQAYAKRATGNWLWQVDVDEFYMPQDMTWIFENLLLSPHIQAVSFKQIQFWGGLNFYTDGWYLRHWKGDMFHRLFRWHPGFVYATHRPPTILDENGNDLRKHGWIDPRKLERSHIFLYHYSLVFPQQVVNKSIYYSNVEWGSFSNMKLWVDQNYNKLQNPYRVHNVYQYPSWLERYSGAHPPQVLVMWDDIQRGMFPSINIRPMADIEALLDSPFYSIRKFVLKALGPAVWGFQILVKRFFNLLPGNVRPFIKTLFRKRHNL